MWMLAVSGCLVAASCTAPDDPRLAGDPGYPAYKEHCRKCHGDDGRRVRASRMAKREVDLTSPAFRDTTSLEDVFRIVRTGKGKMEGHEDDLSPEEIEAVSRLVMRLGREAAP
jgi:mono/diheme cytochrome c family protein